MEQIIRFSLIDSLQNILNKFKFPNINNQIHNNFAKSINHVNDDIDLLKKELTVLKMDEEINEEQAICIKESVRKRVNDLLNDDSNEKSKYYRTFCIRCYTEMRKYGMGSSYRRTKNKNYQKVIDNIELWYPTIGINNLKLSIDEKAIANKKAKENGY
jgi:glucosamine 6-phosphate synthetase-like amidotransferase/phosphosugar isomerase protein